MAAIVALSAAAAPAHAHDPRAGGAVAPSRPVVSKVACAGDRVCARGETLTLAGEHLGATRVVTFLGGRGSRDDRRARPRLRDPHLLTVRVPARARSGQIRITNRVGSTRVRTRLVIRRARARSASAAQRDTLYAGGPPIAFRYRAPATAAGAAQVEVARVTDGVVVGSWPVQPGPDGTGAVTWGGMQGGVPVAVGRYAFRVTGPAAGAVAPEGGALPAFDVFDSIFPVRGKHRYGTATNRFGGGRGHGGQDVFARCGTRLAAARGGTVAFSGYHSRAGNYVVITGPEGRGFAYMHMRSRSSLRAGDRVMTGQTIGRVGQTGRASGCHLHFELWSAPGWQRGSAVDPRPELRRWDAFS